MDNLFVGCALSDVNEADLPTGLRVPERLTDYISRFQKRVGSSDFSFELQPEDVWTVPARFPDQFVERKTNRWWRTFRQNARLLDAFSQTAGPIGVHQPIRGRDILSSDYFDKYRAIAETQQAMSFAHFIHADYFVFHLAMTDRWAWDRKDQITKAFKALGVFHAYYHASDFSFVPCIELLEYPKFPATGGESCEIMAESREVWPEIQFAFDVSHLWGSRNRMIVAHEWESKRKTPIPFIDALDYALEQTWQDIYVVHLGGCWESETHAVPGLHPQQDPFQYPLKLRESPGVYLESGEMNLNKTLDLLLEYTLRRGRPLNLMLEIFDRDIEQVLEATRQIRDDLTIRVQGKAQKAKSSRRDSEE